METDYELALKRYKVEAKLKEEPKNFWVYIDELTKNHHLREEMINKAEVFKSQTRIEQLRRCNLPFWYVKPENINELRKLGIESESHEQRQLVKEYLKEYEKVMVDFKKKNKHMFKRRETFSISGFDKLAQTADEAKKDGGVEVTGKIHKRKDSKKSVAPGTPN